VEAMLSDMMKMARPVATVMATVNSIKVKPLWRWCSPLRGVWCDPRLVI